MGPKFESDVGQLALLLLFPTITHKVDNIQVVGQCLHSIPQFCTQGKLPATMAQPLPAPTFTDADLYRYRKQRGVNLGSYLSCCRVRNPID